MHVSNYVALLSAYISVHGSSLDDFQQALTAPQAQLEQVEIISSTRYCYYGIPMLNRTGAVH